MQFRFIAITVLSLCLLVGCSSMSPEQSGAKSGSGNTGAWDADSRNNENASLGAKSVNNPPQPGKKTPSLDRTIAHYNTHLFMNRELANQIAKTSNVSDAAVAVTNNNVYVAVDLDGQNSMMLREQSAQKQQDSATGAGIFGTGAGAQMDWSSTKALPKKASELVFKELRVAYPNANIYISGNPHFVSRMMYYDLNQRQGKGMENYVNEFNTMVQYAFPDYSNGRNQMSK